MTLKCHGTVTTKHVILYSMYWTFNNYYNKFIPLTFLLILYSIFLNVMFSVRGNSCKISKGLNNLFLRRVKKLEWKQQ